MIFDQYEQILTTACSSRKGEDPIVLVYHWTGGWRNAQAVARIDYRRKKKRVSAHFTIGRPEADVCQSVDTDKAAWHVSRKLRFMDGLKKANQRSIGVEVSNRGYLRGDDWERLKRRQIFTGRHPNPRARKREWEKFTDAQVDSIQRLTDDLFKAHPTLKYICGHSDWAGAKAGAKLDPGPAFPWDRIRWPERSWVLTFDYGSGEWIHKLTEAV